MYLTQTGAGTLEGNGGPVNGNGAERAGAEEQLALAAPEAAPAEAWMLGAMAGRSAAMQRLFTRMKCTAPYFRMATAEGETGAGKMLVAQTLCRIGPSAAGGFAPFAASEFLEDPEARWQESGRGMMYLARVDELSAELQGKLRDFLARVAHERMRTHVVKGPLQLVVGSQAPLRQLASTGAFRPDLASHLTAIRFSLPPLRERQEDIPLLANLFLRRWSKKHARGLRGFAPGALESLSDYRWPGNVRELESAVSAAALECSGQWIRAMDFPRLQWGAPPPVLPAAVATEDANLDRAILRHIARVLALAGGNKVRAARMLGISRSTLYRMLETGALGEGGG